MLNMWNYTKACPSATYRPV